MPVHAVKGGFRWGSHGKVYKNRAGAERQARAIYASGYRSDAYFGPKGRGSRRLQAGKLKVPQVIENRYVLKLRKILKAVHKHFLAELTRREDAYNRRTATLQELGIRVVAAIRKPVGEAFDEMAAGVQKANRLALKPIGVSDLRMSAEIQKFRDKNIGYMENAARAYADQVRDLVEDPENFGLRVEDLAEKIRERGDVSESRAELIARDQTLKLNGQINKTRQENAGVTKYVWNTSHDERVRDSHRELDGQTFSWLDPPEPGHPGDDFQCRCIAIPVFEETEEE